MLQEHVALLRSLAVRFPKQYADLSVLLDKDAELDFFNNVAHLQLHRRQRALQRLTKVGRPSQPALPLLVLPHDFHVASDL